MNKTRKELIEIINRQLLATKPPFLRNSVYFSVSEATDLLRELEADCKEEYRVQSIASYFSKKTPYPTAWSNDILDYILNRSKDLPQPPKTEK